MKAKPTIEKPIVVSVRLDSERYVWLKTRGAITRQSLQKILVQAIDDYRMNLNGK